MTNDICGIDICGGVFKRRSATRSVGAKHGRGLKPTATVMRSLRDWPARGASLDGSRAFQRPVCPLIEDHARRIAAVEWSYIWGMGFKPRSATRGVGVNRGRGLKPTATVMWSLRDWPARGASLDGSRAFQRPVCPLIEDHARRIAAVEPFDWNRKMDAWEGQEATL